MRRFGGVRRSLATYVTGLVITIIEKIIRTLAAIAIKTAQTVLLMGNGSASKEHDNDCRNELGYYLLSKENESLNKTYGFFSLFPFSWSSR